MMSGSGDCFFKCADTYTGYKDSEESGKHDTTQGTQETQARNPKEMDYMNSLTKNSKYGSKDAQRAMREQQQQQNNLKKLEKQYKNKMRNSKKRLKHKEDFGREEFIRELHSNQTREINKSYSHWKGRGKTICR